MNASIIPATRRQAGITLIETALVLIVIGLLLGAVLQGRSLVRSMQAKDVIAMAKDLSSAAHAFRDRYHYLPGDWPLKADEIPNVSAGGNGNGLIDLPAPSGSNPSPISETTSAPLHLLHAGFIRGDGQLNSRFGKVCIVGNSAAAGSVTAAGDNPIPATIRNLIEFDNLPCDILSEVDLKLDDGRISSGNSRASMGVCINEDIVAAFATPL
jgi:type II secretory pathway pseudopilin PulG